MNVKVGSTRERLAPLTRLKLARRAQEIVAEAHGVAISTMTAPSRGRAHYAFARQVAMYLCHTALGLSLSEVALAFARDRTTVSHACHLIEDLRDEPDLDGMLEGLERQLAQEANPAASPSAPTSPLSASLPFGSPSSGQVGSPQ